MRKLGLLLGATLLALGCAPIGMRLTIDETVEPPRWEKIAELAEGPAGAYFGTSVDISDNYVIVGAPATPEGGTSRGAAYIYSLNNLTEPVKITSNSPADAKQFGRNVSLSDDYAVVRSSGVDEIEIFERAGTSWTWAATFVGAGNFGYALDIYGDRVVAGDHTNNLIRVYRKNGAWAEEQEISKSDRFGYSVSIYGSYIVVGADQFNNAGPPPTAFSGAAYIYQKSATWIEMKRIEPEIKTVNGYFGRSVSLYDGNLIISERGTAKVYFYKLEGTEWMFTEAQSIAGVAIGDEFGTPVSISDRISLASAYQTDGAKGAVYVFENYGGQWLHKQKLAYDSGETDDFFGFSSSTRGEYIILGGYGDDNTYGVDAGSALVFHRE